MRGKARTPSIVTVANEKVSIVTACQMVGMDLPDDIAYGRSLKVRCPFGGVYHSDQGASPAMRIYVDNNTAWCFSCSIFFTPVKLVAMAWDQDQHSAAVELLDRVGYKPISLARAWSEAIRRDVEPDRHMLSAALKTYCSRICPDWDDRQFDPTTAATLSRCLGLLDLVRDDDDAREWLAGGKRVMRATLHLDVHQDAN